MGSKGRIPLPHLRRPLPGPGMGHPDAFTPPGMRPPHGAFPPFDMLPPPEVMEQKLAGQHLEMQKLATENQRLAATHGTLRQDLAAIQHELQMVHAHVGAVKSDREQQIRGLLDRIGKMEAELQGAEPLKKELQQARAEAQSLLAAREELASRVQQLTEDHQRAHIDLQQIPALMSELDSLRQEYQHCRATYDYEKKLYNDHLESLQVMEKNYMTMASEVEKLRAKLTKNADIDRRTAGAYGGFTGYDEKEVSGHYPVGQNPYDDAYGVTQRTRVLEDQGISWSLLEHHLHCCFCIKKRMLSPLNQKQKKKEMAAFLQVWYLFMCRPLAILIHSLGCAAKCIGNSEKMGNTVAVPLVEYLEATRSHAGKRDTALFLVLVLVQLLVVILLQLELILDLLRQGLVMMCRQEQLVLVTMCNEDTLLLVMMHMRDLVGPPIIHIEDLVDLLMMCRGVQLHPVTMHREVLLRPVMMHREVLLRRATMHKEDPVTIRREGPLDLVMIHTEELVDLVTILTEDLMDLAMMHIEDLVELAMMQIEDLAMMHREDPSTIHRGDLVMMRREESTLMRRGGLVMMRRGGLVMMRREALDMRHSEGQVMNLMMQTEEPILIHRRVLLDCKVRRHKQTNKQTMLPRQHKQTNKQTPLPMGLQHHLLAVRHQYEMETLLGDELGTMLTLQCILEKISRLSGHIDSRTPVFLVLFSFPLFVISLQKLVTATMRATKSNVQHKPCFSRASPDFGREPTGCNLDGSPLIAL